MRPKRRVLIVGGGFGGLSAARSLAGGDVEITLLDRSNHHLFQPLLYQVATAALSPGDIAEPIRAVLRRVKNARVLLGEATGVDLARQVLLALGPQGPVELGYDWLILAAGARTTWFGHGDWEARAPGLKSLDDALQLRSRVLLAFERAEWCPDPEERRRLLTFVVVGAGPTGVEMAGALSEIARRTLAKDFRQINPTEARVVLVEGGPAVLGACPPRLQARAFQQLLDLAVEVRVGSKVREITDDAVLLDTPGGPEEIGTRTVVWAAGVQAAPIGRALQVEVDRMGRPLVGADLSIPGHPEVLVIGDLAHARGPDGQPLPGVAQVAIQGGVHAAASIRADRAGRPRPDFAYKDLGSMATIGRSRAVALLGRLHFSGRLAWLMWLFVHLMSLVGFRNRVVVLFQWAWSYLTWERNARLIRGDEGRD